MVNPNDMHLMLTTRKKLKQEGIKNVSLLNLPSSEDMRTLIFVDEVFSKVKTVVNIDGKLEIFIEKN